MVGYCWFYSYDNLVYWCSLECKCLIVERFKKLNQQLIDPLVSSDIGIYMLSNLDDSVVVYQLHNVVGNMYCCPLKMDANELASLSCTLHDLACSCQVCL